jgi:hypothetical protein
MLALIFITNGMFSSFTAKGGIYVGCSNSRLAILEHVSDRLHCLEESDHDIVGQVVVHFGRRLSLELWLDVLLRLNLDFKFCHISVEHPNLAESQIH